MARKGHPQDSPRERIRLGLKARAHQAVENQEVHSQTCARICAGDPAGAVGTLVAAWLGDTAERLNRSLHALGDGEETCSGARQAGSECLIMPDTR